MHRGRSRSRDTSPTRYRDRDRSSSPNTSSYRNRSRGRSRDQHSRYDSRGRKGGPNNNSYQSRSPNRRDSYGNNGNGSSYKGRESHRHRHRSFSRSRSRSPARKHSVENGVKQQIVKELQNIDSKTSSTNKSINNGAAAVNGVPTTTNTTNIPKLVNFEEEVIKRELEKEEAEEEEILLDFEDLEELEERKKKEEEELKRQAEERRKRLEEIKLKHQQPPPPPQPLLDSNPTDSLEGTRRARANSFISAKAIDERREQLRAELEATKNHNNASEMEVIENSILNKNAVFPTNGEELEEVERMMEITETEAEDEGNQLARERLAVEAQKDTLGKVTFDMFSDSPSDLEKNQGKLLLFPPTTAAAAGLGLAGKRATREALLDGENPHLQSNWDDHDGYYKATIGELIGDRFQILGIVGKGVFSTVLKCVDTRIGPYPDDTNELENKKGSPQNIVAVKMIRNNDIMRKAAEKEKNILLSLTEKDPQNKRFCVRLITYLEYRAHVALVFEYQSMNLREALKKFGKDVGINITAVRLYARQLFLALRYLSELRIIHGDIKLDNILLSEDLKQVRLCDFGSAFYETDTDNDPTPYLVNRFSRAPEIILGLAYDRQIDFWSICVSLFELFTGHVMFPGRSNNEMLKLMMTMKGRFPHKMLKSHFRSYEQLQLEPHFTEDYRFRSHETDPVTGKPVVRILDITNPTRDLAQIMRSSRAGADDLKVVNQFIDLIDKGINLDPSKRLTVVGALKHPFFMKQS